MIIGGLEPGLSPIRYLLRASPYRVFRTTVQGHCSHYVPGSSVDRVLRRASQREGVGTARKLPTEYIHRLFVCSSIQLTVADPPVTTNNQTPPACANVNRGLGLAIVR